jgi:hypothetical protein
VARFASSICCSTPLSVSASASPRPAISDIWTAACDAATAVGGAPADLARPVGHPARRVDHHLRRIGELDRQVARAGLEPGAGRLDAVGTFGAARDRLRVARGGQAEQHPLIDHALEPAIARDDHAFAAAAHAPCIQRRGDPGIVRHGRAPTDMRAEIAAKAGIGQQREAVGTEQQRAHVDVEQRAQRAAVRVDDGQHPQVTSIAERAGGGQQRRIVRDRSPFGDAVATRRRSRPVIVFRADAPTHFSPFVAKGD